MLWTHPLFLSGLGALAAPVLIHLLMKLQGRKVRFGTLRFLPITKPAREKKRISHWLLLLLRLVLLVLLIAAFARPYWPVSPATAASQNQSRALVLVLDCSASMQAGDTTTRRWEEALAAASKVLDTLAGTDQVAIIGVAEQAEVITPWGPPNAARIAISELKVTNEPGHLADGLQLAATLLGQAPAATNPELVLISDLQKSSWSGIESASLPTGTRCEIRPLAGPETENIAVTGVQSKGTTGSWVKVSLQNFSTQKRTGLSVTCTLDQQPFFQGKVDIDAGSTAQLALPALMAAGWHQLQVDLADDDALTGDNHFFASVFVPQPISIVVTEPHPELKNFQRSSYFLTSALNPEIPDDDAADSPTPTGSFNVNVIDPAGLAAALASLPKPTVVILPPLPEIPTGLGATLKNYLQRGGGLLGWVGPGIDTLGYNGEFGDIWPAHLIEVESRATLGGNGGWILGWWNRESPLFAPFGQGGRGDLTLPQFRQRMRLEATSDAEVLATFDDQTPFLLARQIGAGRVLLINSSADTRWSDWPIHKTFLPLVQQMAYYLAQRTLQAGFALGPSLVPTRHGQIDLGAALANQQLQLVSPHGPVIPIQTDRTGVVTEANLEQPGYYEIRNAANEPQKSFCVNFPAIESDLAAYRPDEITSQLKFSSPVVSRPPSAGEGALSGRREWWPWLLALLLPLLFLELAWANRIRA
jgi:hypothetical protein